MTHGGAREGSGRPGKYTDSNGNKLPTRRDQVPDILTKQDLEELARQKIKQQQQQKETADK